MIGHYDGIALIKQWAMLFDAHAAPLTIYDYTSGDDFVMRFEQTEFRGLPGLEAHHLLKSQFFDESHLYYDFQVVSAGPPLVMTTRMVWDTQRRCSDGHAEHLIADIGHRWTFIRRLSDGRTVFQQHELLSLSYRNGASPSEADAENLHIDPARVDFNKR